MVIGDIQTPVQALPQIVTGAQAAAKKLNAAGGIAGHQITILSCNTQGDPNVSAACARSAVSDHVSAVVGMLALTSASIVPILQAANIPVLGSFDINSVDHISPVSFPFDSSAVQLVGEIVAMPGWQSCKHPAMLYDSDLDSAARAAVVMKKIYAALNPPVQAKIVPITTTTTNFTAQIATLLSGGTDCAWTGSTPTPMLSLIKAVAASGQNVKLGNNASTLTAAQLQQLGAAGKGVYISSSFQLPSTPAGDAFAQAMTSINAKAQDDQDAEGSYAAVLILAAVGKSLTNFSGPSVLAALNAAQNIDVGVLPLIKSFPANGGVASIPRVSIFGEYDYEWDGSALHITSTTPVDVEPYLLKYGSN
jgi:ABC-type branched-subunit amino acid transport system substrate-binding protein